MDIWNKHVVIKSDTSSPSFKHK